jgi:hypothetical protein
MYYKDEKIEIRLGLGIKEFKSITTDTYTFILTKVNEDKSDTVIEEFSSNTEISLYPTDGLYKLEVIPALLDPYFVYLNVNDSFITEFVKQVKDILCNCKCSDTCKNSETCKDSLNGTFAIKRQKIFNTTLILPNTIKPFSYGQGAVTNPPLYNFIQLFFNETIVDKKTELGKEYFYYYTNGTVANNAELFNSIITGYYYGIYLYSKTLLLNNTIDLVPSPTQKYLEIIDTVFDYSYIKNCLKCYTNNIDYVKLIQNSFLDSGIAITLSDQNNISRVIKVYDSNLSGTGTLEEQIAEYINSLNYDKTEVDSDIWIEYIADDVVATSNVINLDAPLIVTGEITNLTRDSFTLGASPQSSGLGSNWGQSEIQLSLTADFLNYVTQSSPTMMELIPFTVDYTNPLYAWGNLVPNTTYYYRAKMIVNPAYQGEIFWYGDTKTVTTLV